MSLLVAMLVTTAVLMPSSGSVRLHDLLADARTARRQGFSRPAATGAGLRRGGRRGRGRRRGAHPDLPLTLDLLAAALASGQPVGAAVRCVGEALASPMGEVLQQAGAALLLGARVDEAWPDDLAPDLAAAVTVLRRLLDVSLASGGRTAAVLHAGADAERRRHRRQNEARLAQLSVRMVLPLGLCALPAFVAVAVVPVVVSIAGSSLR